MQTAYQKMIEFCLTQTILDSYYYAWISGHLYASNKIGSNLNIIYDINTNKSEKIY